MDSHQISQFAKETREELFYDKEKLLEARVAAVTASIYDGKKLEFTYSDPIDLFEWCIDGEYCDSSLDNLMYLDTFHRWRASIPGWTSMSVEEIIDELGLYQEKHSE